MSSKGDDDRRVRFPLEHCHATTLHDPTTAGPARLEPIQKSKLSLPFPSIKHAYISPKASLLDLST